jgi:hypothetical protein
MTAVPGTNSYGDAAGFNTYLTDRGYTLSGDADQVLIRAMDYIESREYSGVRYEEDQTLEFPRSPAALYTDPGDVPPDIIKAQYVCARLIDEGNDLMKPSNNGIKRSMLGRGATDTTYKDDVSNEKTYPEVDALLLPFFAGTGTSFRRGL